MSSKEKFFLLLCGIFFAALIMANIIGISKFWSFFGLMVPIGIIPYPITFLATDLISELYGKERATYVVFVGFILNIFLLIIMYFAHLFPAHEQWTEIIMNRNPAELETFEYVYSLMATGTIASMMAYLLAQFYDVKIFHWIKTKTKGRHLWLRNNGSTLISQMIDTVAVITLTFIGDVLDNNLTISSLIDIILSAYVFKLFVALSDTPFFYLGVKLYNKYIDQPEDESI